LGLLLQKLDLHRSLSGFVEHAEGDFWMIVGFFVGYTMPKGQEDIEGLDHVKP
jgi:hypothetical protein